MNTTSVTIAVDAMGGDSGPEINILGVMNAVQSDASLEVLLVGQLSVLQSECVRLKVVLPKAIKLVDASEVIAMTDHAVSAIRSKKKSSIHVGLELVRSGAASAFVSAGNSGAVMAGASLLLGRIEGVERPAIVVRMPVASGFVLILDAGANVDCRPEHLAQFAKMGSVLSEVIDCRASPRVGLLSNAAESHKGNELTRQTHEILTKMDLNYIGYVEGRDIFHAACDVVVCDGFVGNIVLKASEGLAESLLDWFKRAVTADPLARLGSLFLRHIVKRFRKKFDYQPYGAAPLLGINGLVFISHGGSTAIAIQNGVLTAKRAVEQNFVQKIAAGLRLNPQEVSQSS